MQTCLSPWPLLPPRGSTQEGPGCKAWPSGSRALHLCSRLPPNRLCTLVFSDSAVRASPSPALVPPPGRHNQTQSDTITCNQAEQRGGPAWFSVTWGDDAAFIREVISFQKGKQLTTLRDITVVKKFPWTHRVAPRTIDITIGIAAVLKTKGRCMEGWAQQGREGIQTDIPLLSLEAA